MLSEPISKLTWVEQVNFLLTNRIPRRLLTQFMGWYSKIENPWLTRLSIRVWRLFADDLRLYEASETEFQSLHDCFIRTLKPGTRPVCDQSEILVSPCDAEVGAFGDLANLQLIQAKGFPYTLDDLLGDKKLAEPYRDGRFVTLRLTSSMYHHFHAPRSGFIDNIHYISGDTWNVNPIALKKIERLFCRNERAVIQLQAEDPNENILLVPVAAILVASMRFVGLPQALNLRYSGPNEICWSREFAKGERMGYFEHGSTIVMLTSKAFSFCSHICTGEIVRMGEPLMIRTNP